MTGLERSAFAARCKDIGNRGFKASDWGYAVLAYQEGIRYLEYLPHDSEMQPLRFDHGGAQLNHLDKDMSLAVTLFSNLAAAFLKLQEPHEALKYAEKALRFDAAHAKALYRRGQALLALGEYSEALVAAEELLRKEPGNPDAASLKSAAALGAKVATQKEKALFSKMLS
ncbi:cyp41 [Symbiodinium pilosum]|uniref:peptidylprolyl isomerase n=1 Tax=Symbiodinium pilosum TaxID=2952 RepID=A0A812WQ28_SYMPI|nr:cyp41 [Symbiodinium pilosum]